MPGALRLPGLEKIVSAIWLDNDPPCRPGKRSATGHGDPGLASIVT